MKWSEAKLEVKEKQFSSTLGAAPIGFLIENRLETSESGKVQLSE